VPPLRERKEDIPALVRHIVTRVARRLAKPIEDVTPAAIEALCSYSWPGNVRELENVIERAAILSPGPQLDLGELTPRSRDTSGASAFATLAEVERRYIQDVLEHTGWVVSGEQGAARLLGLKPATLDARIRKLGIARPR
jgi:DNA-binding NtrC family response regulator